MTREELFEQVKKLSFVVYQRTGVRFLEIEDFDGNAIAWVDTENMYYLGMCNASNWYPDDTRKALLDVLVEYAKTPIEKRETKRYYVRYSKEYYNTTCEYLNIDEEFGMSFSPLKQAIEDGCQTSFTEEEIEQLREKYPFLDERFEQGYLFKEEI